jgi:hypothetical protein
MIIVHHTVSPHGNLVFRSLKKLLVVAGPGFDDLAVIPVEVGGGPHTAPPPPYLLEGGPDPGHRRSSKPGQGGP